jgi:plastocyanin
MNRKLILILTAIVIVAGGIAIAKSGDDSDMAMSGMTHNTAMTGTKQPVAKNMVIIDNLAFGPESLSVKVGTTVTWRNDDTASHTITFEDSSLADQSSDLTAPGKTFKHTFDSAGTFSYHCTPHPFMKAKIIVTP